MNDNEIIKALECCCIKHCCEECPYKGVKCKLMNGVLSDALDLINRQQAEKEALIAGQETMSKYIEEQQAEIERLQNLTEKDFEQTAISTVKRHQKWIEYRAIKEFAKKIRQKISAMVCSPDLLTLDDYDKCIDDVLKEMVGDNDVRFSYTLHGYVYCRH